MAFMTDYVSEISPFDSDYTTRKTTVLNVNKKNHRHFIIANAN